MMKRLILSLAIALALLSVVTGQKVDMSLFHGMRPRNVGPTGMSGRVTAIAVEIGRAHV